MRLKRILLILLACFALAVSAQPTQQKTEWEWYLDEVVDGEFVGRNDFEYYYTPSASDMEQQRNKGEVTYFLNSPVGLSAKKTCSLIDRIRAMGTWTDANTIYWKEFRYENNKFRFNVKREALDDGTYYVSVVETASYYKSLGKKDKKDEQEADAKAPKAKEKKSTRHSTRSRRQVTLDDEDDNADVAAADDEPGDKPVVTEQERRRAARQSDEERRQQERLAKRRAQEEQKAQQKAQKEAEKQRKAEEKKQKAEEKKQKAEEKRLKQQEEKQRREQQRQEREQARRDKRDNATRQAAAAQAAQSKYHYDDVALWLSEKYDFTQTRGDGTSCEMYSTAVKDVEMAKLAIKNALKGSNARMAVPWRLNSDTGAVETGYTVDGHVLVFAVGKNGEGNITINVTEVSSEEFENFKQGLNE